jgi:copper chaperone
MGSCILATLFNRSLFMQHTFTVTGMTCGHCEKAVTQAIRNLDPQATVQIDRAQNQVRVESAQSHEALAEAIADEGYRVQA